MFLLIALVDAWNKAGTPAQALPAAFKSFYKLHLCSQQAYTLWQKDTTFKNDAKCKALIQTRAFLADLEKGIVDRDDDDDGDDDDDDEEDDDEEEEDEENAEEDEKDSPLPPIAPNLNKP